jgi:phytoene dehydrogenase-like protein
VHPFGNGSPFLRSLPLAEHGLEWRFADVDLAHPLEGDRAGVMVRSIEETAAGLGEDGGAWRRAFGPLSKHFATLSPELLQPILHLPRHPIGLARFGLRGGLPATLFARRFATEEAKALFGGVAAHMFYPLNRPLTASVGTMMIAAGHSGGWPVAAGGSQAITTALASLLTSLGGTIETGVTVTSMAQLGGARVSLFDTSPTTLMNVAGDNLPAGTRRAFGRWRYGPAAFKVDLAVEGGIPWRSEACRRAGTVHIAGSFDDIVKSEAALHRGELSERPFILVAQQYLCDPARSVGDVHPVWTYAHVPNGYPHDATELVLDRIEHYAPGLRERIVGRHVTTPGDYASYNANYVGGDIACGASDPRQLIFRPRISLDPYATGIPGVFLCSSATPPGAGVHGMCGHHAAKVAIKYLERPSRQ